jgi:hypothetical protein
MASLLADRLSAARRRQFVGRTQELETFRAALAAPELPFHILAIHGPGGVGKTTLVKELVNAAAELDAVSVHLDARNIEPAPAPFVDALRVALGLDAESSPLAHILASGHRHAIFIDTYETLAPLDDWLREEFLPQLPSNVLIVTSGRNAPSSGWRGDSGWASLIRSLPLRNLDGSEGREYLRRRNIPDAQHAEMLAFTHGHPLALSLVADSIAQSDAYTFKPGAVPDVVKALLERFVEGVPGPDHRAALECCGLVRVTTQGLLSQMLDRADVHELFEWLRGLSFIESGPEGLFPHDLAREALCADLRWRDPDLHVELHHRARRYYALHLTRAHSHEQQRLLLDYVFLHRDNPVMRAIFQWQGTTSVIADAVREDDFPELVSIVREHEGEESSALAAYWFRRQPHATLVLRDQRSAIAGFMTMIAIHESTAEDRERDPAIARAHAFLARHAPLRPGEGATHFRFWMGRDTYQSVSPAQSLVFVNVARHYLTTASLAYTFFPVAEPDAWAPGFAYIDLHRHDEADFTVGGRTYGVYGHDWRAVPPMRWLEILAERETGGAVTSETAPAGEKHLSVLGEEAFAAAVHDALRCFTRADELRDNPLLRTRLVADAAGSDADAAARIASLRSLIESAIAALEESPRKAKFARVLHRTFIKPASTQERAAELLDLPFSTYRRHLKSGIDEVVRALWLREIGG